MTKRDTPVTALRRMKPEDDWGDKFYAALDALFLVVKGYDAPAMSTPPHIVMADLIEDVRWWLTSSDDVAGSGERLDVERLGRAMRNILWPNWKDEPDRPGLFWNADAEKVAAEYQRLAAPTTQAPREETPEA